MMQYRWKLKQIVKHSPKQWGWCDYMITTVRMIHEKKDGTVLGVVKTPSTVIIVERESLGVWKEVVSFPYISDVFPYATLYKVMGE